MSKFLVRFYPVYPCEELLIYDLDVLKTSGETHNNWRAMVREEFNSIIYSACRHHKFWTVNDAISTYNNNSTYWYIEADSCKHVVEKITALMSMRREELQELSDVERCVFIKALTSEFGDKEDQNDPNKTV